MLFSLYNMFLRPLGKFLKRQKFTVVHAVFRPKSKDAHLSADGTEARPSANGGVELHVSAGTVAAAKHLGRNSAVLTNPTQRARMHWFQAFSRVISSRKERYMSEKDVLKAVASSKFKPNMEVGLRMPACDF